MNGFEKVKFKGVFRDYQQRVLDNADKHLKDGKINIVAAPGSGKTVLGLELIVRLKAPCIVLSPTTAIRQQWGERFAEMFIEEGENLEEFVSNDLHNVKTITSITYQALYMAMEKKSDSADNEDEDENGEVDCSDVDILALVKSCGIKTVCLDEAHHLKNEWQKALEKFISALDKDVKIIALTATPPYDSEEVEWKRYMSICGEIDEEIFVPELVGRNTLCPHQDYVYFNYPLEEETERFDEHKQNVEKSLAEIGELDLMKTACDKVNGEKDYSVLFSQAKEYIALLVLFRYYNFNLSQKLINELTAKKGLPQFSIQYAQTALQFLLDGELFGEEEKEQIISVLKENSVYEKRKVCLDLTEKLKRSLVSSAGKLESIGEIAKSEAFALKEKLRMLVLTDYIKKEGVSKIATDEKLTSVNVVSIFETIRRSVPHVKIGVLSGTLVILPASVSLDDIKHTSKDIPNTEYKTVDISGPTHKSVNYVGKLFASGEIQILVGTKSLLGEGWDSPCINSLILASFVGSFVLSNQMRGRAIRIDKTNPDKVSNIWHLVSVEPDYMFKDNVAEKTSLRAKDSKKEISSCDYDVLKRRFNSFMGPDYETGVIESGIERISAIKPPFDKGGFDRINKEMLSLSANRENVKEKWKGEVSKGKYNVCVETEIPKESKAPLFTFGGFVVNFLLVAAAISLGAFALLFAVLGLAPLLWGSLGLEAVVLVLLGIEIKKWLNHKNSAASVKTLGKAVYKTLCACGLISSSSSVETRMDSRSGKVSLQLIDAVVHDQNIFNTAMSEMFSPIENPRYILIGKTIFKNYNYKLSFACPSIIGKKKEYVEELAKQLKKNTGNFESVYAHSENGRSLILKCRKNSYISSNEKISGKRYKVSHWE